MWITPSGGRWAQSCTHCINPAVAGLTSASACPPALLSSVRAIDALLARCKVVLRGAAWHSHVRNLFYALLALLVAVMKLKWSLHVLSWQSFSSKWIRGSRRERLRGMILPSHLPKIQLLATFFFFFKNYRALLSPVVTLLHSAFFLQSSCLSLVTLRHILSLNFKNQTNKQENTQFS